MAWDQEQYEESLRLLSEAIFQEDWYGQVAAIEMAVPSKNLPGSCESPGQGAEKVGPGG